MRGVYTAVFFGLVAGMAAFGRGFAYVGIPGTPVYVTEAAMLLVAVAYVMELLLYPAAARYWKLPLGSLLLTFLIYGLGHVLAGWREYGLEGVRDSAQVYYSLFVFLTAIVLIRYSDLERFTKVIIVASSWNIVVTVWNLVRGDYFDAGVGGARFSNPSVVLQVISAWLFLISSVVYRTGHRKWLPWGLSGLLLGVVFFTAHRSALLALLVGVGAILCFSNVHRALRVVAVSALVLVVLGGALAFIPGTRDWVGGTYQRYGLVFSTEENNAASRLVLWNIGLHVIAEHPLFGIGVGTPNGDLFVSPWGERFSPHNGFVALGVRFGVIGLVLFVSLLLGFYVVLGRSILRMERGGIRSLAVGVFASHIAAVVLVFFNTFLETPFGAPFFWSLMGAGLRVATLETTPEAGGGWKRMATPRMERNLDQGCCTAGQRTPVSLDSSPFSGEAP